MKQTILVETYDYHDFMSRDPMLVGVVGSWKFYEHPTRGDEAPLVGVNTATRECVLTSFWDVPSLEELHHHAG